MNTAVVGIEAQFLLPLRDNDGKPYSREDWDDLDERLAEFGGFTVIPEVSGWWRDDGEIYRDVSNIYVVDLTSWADMSQWLETVRWAQVRFRQIAIRIRVAGIPEILR
ncbi:MAG: hypothetical protein NTZ05_15655 [Chloroflexi bacterium]|nr:hypothetical protein [Chloroflexota bacterium]